MVDWVDWQHWAVWADWADWVDWVGRLGRLDIAPAQNPTPTWTLNYLSTNYIRIRLNASLPKFVHGSNPKIRDRT